MGIIVLSPHLVLVSVAPQNFQLFEKKLASTWGYASKYLPLRLGSLAMPRGNQACMMWRWQLLAWQSALCNMVDYIESKE